MWKNAGTLKESSGMKFCFMFVEEMKIIKEFILTHTTGDNGRQCTLLFGVLAMGMYFVIDTQCIYRLTHIIKNLHKVCGKWRPLHFIYWISSGYVTLDYCLLFFIVNVVHQCPPTSHG